MRLYLGVAKEVAEETTVRPVKREQIPEWLTEFLSIREHALWLGLPLGVWLILLYCRHIVSGAALYGVWPLCVRAGIE